jgi:acetyltransferase-like isoleucine patch superfamily enzyme
MIIGDGTWIGQQCFLHSAGGIVIGRDVGIGPGVQIITSYHAPTGEEERPILHRPIVFEPVEIGAGADIGAGAIVLPGARIGEGVQVGAGAVVRGSIPARATVVGVPARPLRSP